MAVHLTSLDFGGSKFSRYRTSRYRTSRYGKKTFKFAAATLWNSLPDHFRTENSFSQIKSLMQSWNGTKCCCSACRKYIFCYCFCSFICIQFLDIYCLFQCLSNLYRIMLNFLLYYVMLHVDADGNPARHCHLVPAGIYMQYARYSKNSFRFAAFTLWNSLQDHFKTENSFSQFKSFAVLEQVQMLLFYMQMIKILLLFCLNIFIF